MAVRTLLADDSEVFLAALADVLAPADGIDVVATALTGDDALTRCGETQPDVAVVDFDMPGGGPDLVRRLSQLSPAPRILVFSARDDADTVLAVLAAGATSYVAKGGLDEDLPTCVRRCAEGRLFVLGEAAEGVRRKIAVWSTSES